METPASRRGRRHVTTAQATVGRTASPAVLGDLGRPNVWSAADWVPQSERERLLGDEIAYRETLIREMHHRVKNNLTLLVALARAEARRLGPEARLVLQDLASRVVALAAVHDQLYCSPDHVAVAAGSFLQQICGALDAEDQRCSVVTSADLLLAPAQASPVGMIVAEAVTNSLRHAYGGEAGRIDVRLVSCGAQIRLQVQDYGYGFAPGENARSSGLRLMEVLARQLGGELRVVSGLGLGVLVELSFPAALIDGDAVDHRRARTRS